MIRVPRIVKDYAEAGSLDEHVPVQSLVDDRTFATSAGDLFTVLKAQPRDPACLDPAELDRVSRSFERAARLFGEDFRIYQYLVKRKGVQVTSSAKATGVAAKALASRTSFLNARAENLHHIDVYIVVLYSGWRAQAKRSANGHESLLSRLRWTLSADAEIDHLDQGLKTAAHFLAEKVDSFIAQLGDDLSLAVLDPHAAFRFLRRLLNYAPHKAETGRLKYPVYLGRQLAHSSLECHRDHLRLDDDYVQVLSLKEPPSQTFAHLLNDLMAVPGNFIAVIQWQPEENSRMRRRIQTKRRHFHHTKRSISSEVTASGPTPSKDVLTDTSAVAFEGELGACLEAMEVGGCQFGQFTLTLILHDTERAALQRSAIAATKVLAAHDGAFIEERFNLLNAWLAVLPGNDLFNRRRMWLSSRNYADLSFLFAPREGERTNPYLKDEYLLALETPTGTPYYLNLHHQDVAHALLLGATGSGKSFFLNLLLTHVQKYNPFTVIFDLGGGYDTLTKLLGGAYTAIGPEGSEFSINPFTLPPTEENRHFLVMFCRVLIESAGYRLSSADERDLIDQVDNMYALEPDQRRLLTLANLLKRSMRLELAKWVPGGPYARWFDSTTDSVTFARLQTFDLEGMANYPQVLEPLLFYILHRASAAIYDQASLTAFKVFVMDEAWRFLKHPVISAYVREALKTWRKKSAAMIMATQSLEDLRQSELLSVVVESCPTRFFLANPGMDRSFYRDVLHLNDTEAERIAALVPKKQVLVKQPDLAKVVDVNVDPLGHWICTTDAEALRARRLAFEEHGPEQGLEILASRSAG